MTRALRVCIALAIVARVTAATAPTCIAIDGEHVQARDLAQGAPAFSSIAPDIEFGYAPVPGARRFYRAPELQRLAKRYNIVLPAATELCVERAMEPLRPERVTEAMCKALGVPDARVEILELSRYPVPRGEIQFTGSALPALAAPSVLWRGFVRYAGDHRFAMWARVKVLVRSNRIVAVENLPAGRRIEARQLRLEEYETFPSSQPGARSLDQVVGRAPRHAITAGTAIAPNLLDAPREVERGDVVEVEVVSGAARLKFEGLAESAGRRGDSIPIRNVTAGKTFSARVADKDRVVLAAAARSRTKDASK
jgi:flagella basal body P-ring formation protein FlgA